MKRGRGFDNDLASYLDDAGLVDKETPEPEPGKETLSPVYEAEGALMVVKG
jgi:hypothetical protein